MHSDSIQDEFQPLPQQDSPHFNPIAPINQQQYLKLRHDISALCTDMEVFYNNFWDFRTDFDSFQEEVLH